MYRLLVRYAPLAIIAARSYIVRVVMVSTMRAMPKETIGNHQNLCLMLRMLEKQPQQRSVPFITGSNSNIYRHVNINVYICSLVYIYVHLYK